MTKQQLESAKQALFIMLVIDIVINAAIGFHDYTLLNQLREVRAGTRSNTTQLAADVASWQNAGYFSIFSLLGVAVALVNWLRICYSYAEGVIGCTEMEQRKYTAWGWLPVLNIFKPYQVMSEIYKIGGLNYTRSTGYKKEPASGELLAWWIFWVVAHLLLLILNRAYASANLDIILREGNIPATHLLPTIIKAYDYGVWITATSVLVSIAWFWAVNLLTTRLLKRQPVDADSSFAATIPADNTTPTLPLNSENKGPSTSNEEVWAQALYEFDHGERRLGLWSKVFAEADGNEGKAKATYLRVRAAEMLSESSSASKKLRSQTLPAQTAVASSSSSQPEPILKTAALKAVPQERLSASLPVTSSAPTSASSSAPKSAAKPKTSSKSEVGWWRRPAVWVVFLISLSLGYGALGITSTVFIFYSMRKANGMAGSGIIAFISGFFIAAVGYHYLGIPVGSFMQEFSKGLFGG